MRTMVGVGMTPPKVLGAPNPTSSVMINRTFGAPLGGTTLGVQYGLESSALMPMLPPNFTSGNFGNGKYFDRGDCVAAGEPGGAAPPSCASCGARKLTRARPPPVTSTFRVCSTALPPACQTARIV